MASDAQFSDDAWIDVLKTVDQTYQQLVDHQVELERRNTELEGMRRFLDSVLYAMSDVLIVCGPEGQILEVNHAFQILTELNKTTVLGAAIVDLFTEPDREAIREALSEARQGRDGANVERSLKTANGPAPLELSIAARFDHRRRFVGSVMIGRPVGELRRAYADMETSHQALKDAQSQLVHSEKLASLGRLLAGVAHELNNPISFVYANAHSLERYTERFERYFQRVEAGAERAELVELRQSLKLNRAVQNLRSAVSGALEGAERVRDIVESLRRLSAEGQGEVETFDLVETAANATSWVIKGKASSIPFEVAHSGPVLARGRPGHLQQVVMNLVQNAMDAMEETPKARLDLRVAIDGENAILDVADCGPGIDFDNRLRIFDPFFTTKPVGKGTGLGLSISYKIVEENDGKIQVLDRPGGGALFRLTLPRGDLNKRR